MTFHIQASGTNVTFRWERSNDSKEWSTFGSSKSWAGQTLQRNNVGKYFRCIVTNGDGKTLTSNVVQLRWENSGFFIEDGNRYFAKDCGLLATGLVSINGDIHLFGDSGLKTISKKVYYFRSTGVMLEGHRHHRVGMTPFGYVVLNS